MHGSRAGALPSPALQARIDTVANAAHPHTVLPRIIQVGKVVTTEPGPPRDPLGYHVHSKHVCVVHLHARGRQQVGSRLYQLDGPILAVVPSGETDCDGQARPLNYRYVLFDWPGIARADGTGVTVALPEGHARHDFVRPLTADELGRAVERFRALEVSFRRPDSAGRLAGAAQLLELIALWSQPPATPRVDDAIEAYRALIAQYALDHGVGLAQLAKRLHKSSDHLANRFRLRFGQTPVAYRTHLRLDHARDLLVEGHLQVQQAAAAAGFPDPRYFTRLFRQRFGVSPRAFVASIGGMGR